jgi:hypothetical protein
MIMTAEPIKVVETTFPNFAERYRSFSRLDPMICLYRHCFQLMHDGILDKDARDMTGRCFGSAVVGYFVYDGNEWFSLLFQWMTLRPSSLFEFLDCQMTLCCAKFWEAFEQALLRDTRYFDFLLECLRGFQGRGCVPQDVCIKVENAARWSPLRRAWIQAAIQG